MHKSIIISLLSLLVLSCSQSDIPEGERVSSDGYLVSSVPGTSIQKVVKRSENGRLLESGFVEDGKKVGTWVTYQEGSNFPKTMAGFQNGLYNGPYMEYNNRGQVTLIAHYTNNQLDGPWATYQFGRPTAEATYTEGKLDGVYKEYQPNTGKIQKEMEYKNGVLDGPYRFFDQEGKVTVEYVYKNGKKIEGGIQGD